jgi:hypothetical protein
MRNTIQIAKMEFRMTASNKAFVIITIIGPFLILAMALIPTLLVNNIGSIKEGDSRRHCGR